MLNKQGFMYMEHLNMSDTPLKTAILQSHPHDLAIFMDFDDCLDKTTVRNLTTEQKEILWDLHRITNGGIIITTNSDGRSVFEMAEMDGFPVISEFSTVFRNIPGMPQYLHSTPDCNAAFNHASRRASEEDLDVKITQSAEVLNQDIPVIKLEKKEMGLALVYGKHEQLKEKSITIAKYAFLKARFSDANFEIDESGKDAVEIKIKKAAKADVIDHLKDHPLLNRKLQLAMGDSGSDFELMQRLGKGIIVGNALDTKDQSNINCFKIAATAEDFTETWTFLRTLRNTYKNRTVLTVTNTTKTALARR